MKIERPTVGYISCLLISCILIIPSMKFNIPALWIPFGISVFGFFVLFAISIAGGKFDTYTINLPFGNIKYRIIQTPEHQFKIVQKRPFGKWEPSRYNNFDDYSKAKSTVDYLRNLIIPKDHMERKF